MTFDVLNPTLDFNNDNRADIYWRNDLADFNAIWLMNGGQIGSSAFLPSDTGKSGWTDPTFGDFDGDGTTDFFWHNSLTGQNIIWLMNGTEIQSSLFTASTSNDWEYQVVDFDGDGTTDLFWHNQKTGQTAAWIFDQGFIEDAQFLSNVPSEWQAYVADFNGDRKTDLFWRNETDGRNGIWEMNGTQLLNAAFVDSRTLDWSPTIADFSADGRSDIFWHSSTGRNQFEIYSSRFGQFSRQTLNLPNTGADVGIIGRDAQFDVLFGEDLAVIYVIDPSPGFKVSLWGVDFGQPVTIDLIEISGELVRAINAESEVTEFDIGIADFDGNGFSDTFIYNNEGEVIVETQATANQSASNVITTISPEIGWNPVLRI